MRAKKATGAGQVWLLDTTALLAHYRNECGYREVQRIFEDESARIAICAVSIAEFARRLVALGQDRDAARKAALDYADLADEIVDVDTAVSVRAFELGTLTSERLPLVDALIAGAALLHGAVLVHRDGHFTGLGNRLVSQRLLNEDDAVL